jgi:DNA polymerase-3 subunit alpha
MQFTPLYIETSYAMNGSNIRIDDLVNKAVSLGYGSLAITDPKMHGVIQFYKACIRKNIHPVIGLNLLIEGLHENRKNHVLLLAKTNNGYQNLLQLSSLYAMNNIVSLSEMKLYKKGIIAIILSEESELFHHLANHQINEINEYNTMLHDIFESYYFSVSNNHEMNHKMKQYYKLVVVPKVQYLNQEDHEVYEILAQILNANSSTFLGREAKHYLRSISEIKEDFIDYQEEMNRASQIALSCQVTLDFDTVHLPKYPLKKGINAKDYLFALSMKGLEKRIKNKKKDKKQYQKRLEFELSVINQMGYNDYFLIVWDFVKFAKKNHYLVGPGRGSAAASLVSYCLGITSVDPLEFDLVFERFLNPERITLPDIDMDLPDDKRDHIITYVRDFYGVDKVASICTFGTFQSKSAIRDTARVTNFEGILLNQLTKESEKYSTIQEMMEQSSFVAQIIKQNQEAFVLLQRASKIEGLYRHVSTHAAGIIVTDKPMMQHTPVQNGLLDMLQTQYEASDLEALGLLKIDFLGLRNLTSIDQICQLIHEKEGKLINPYTIPLQDKKTFDLLKKVETTGLFQLESRGMRSLIGQMQIDSFDDIVTILALFRPGPMENIPSYIKRRNQEEEVTYPHPVIEEVLKPTHGIIIYQEQIIQIASLFAGYSLGEADVLRRAVSKKSESILQKERKHFIEKAKQMGRDDATSNLIYDYIVKFANYGFNKAHSVAYAMVSYWMAYLKANYPKYFISILTTSVIGSVKSMKEYIYESNQLGVTIIKPSVNYSTEIFNPEGEALRYPLLGIKNVGVSTVNELLQIREEGLFSSYIDFVGRVHKTLNKRVIESLIYAGALDEFSRSKRTMIEQLDEVINFSMYGDFIKQDDFVVKELEEYSYQELKDFEQQVLGFNLFVNPLNKHQAYIQKHKLFTTSDIDQSMVGKDIRFVGILSSVREITTKNQQKMAFISIEDEHIKRNAVLFQTQYKTYQNDLVKDHVYLWKGKIDNRNNELQIIVNNLLDLDK